MLIKITEHNMWEREKWSYVLDIERQGGAVMNHLIIFIRLANKYFEEAKKSATNCGHGNCFAASRYYFEFFDSIIYDGKYYELHNKGRCLTMNTRAGYNSSSFDTNRLLSHRRVYQAMLAMRDRKENILYKNFDILFLQKKYAGKVQAV